MGRFWFVLRYRGNRGIGLEESSYAISGVRIIGFRLLAGLHYGRCDGIVYFNLYQVSDVNLQAIISQFNKIGKFLVYFFMKPHEVADMCDVSFLRV